MTAYIKDGYQWGIDDGRKIEIVVGGQYDTIQFVYLTKSELLEMLYAIERAEKDK